MFWGVHFQKVRRFGAIDETRSLFAILCGLHNKPQRSGGVKKVSFTDVFSLFLQGHNADTRGALFKECARVSGGVYVGKEMKCK